ncbi:unnamed protein product [Echinostoma caproni]|uniref:Uncharacterized protein n=1 Tax=Echinostoma caproni TaxID=27848 RepID=A0A183A796_9TREM|nr:unnamed protein product [Echinostoma caproni]
MEYGNKKIRNFPVVSVRTHLSHRDGGLRQIRTSQLQANRDYCVKPVWATIHPIHTHARTDIHRPITSWVACRTAYRGKHVLRPSVLVSSHISRSHLSRATFTLGPNVYAH